MPMAYRSTSRAEQDAGLEVACSWVLASSGVSRSCVRRHAVAIVHEVMKGGHQAAVVTLFARATL